MQEANGKFSRVGVLYQLEVSGQLPICSGIVSDGFLRLEHRLTRYSLAIQHPFVLPSTRKVINESISESSAVRNKRED